MRKLCRKLPIESIAVGFSKAGMHYLECPLPCTILRKNLYHCSSFRGTVKIYFLFLLDESREGGTFNYSFVVSTCFHGI